MQYDGLLKIQKKEKKLKQKSQKKLKKTKLLVQPIIGLETTSDA